LAGFKQPALPDQGDQVADLLATEPGLKAKRLALMNQGAA
jgi:hypothetical protein